MRLHQRTDTAPISTSISNSGSSNSGSQVPGVRHRNVELDFLRGVAILLVIGFHFLYPRTGVAALDWISDTLHSVGGVGVDLFFVLSGFLVGGLLLREYQSSGTIRPWRFLSRRAFKIWPPFYVLILVQAIIGRHDRSTFLWQNLLQVQNYFAHSVPHTWSLAVEEHFYIILSVLLFVLIGRSARFIIWTLVALCVVTIAIRIITVSYGDLQAAFRETHCRLDGLLYGVILAAISIFFPERFAALARQRVFLIVCALALCVFIYRTADDLVITRDVGYAVQGVGFALLLVLVYRHSGRLSSQWWYRVVARIGIYSYGIYLWHTVSLEPARHLIAATKAGVIAPTLAWFIAIVAQTALALFVGVVMTHLVEWPSLRLRERLLGSERFALRAAPLAPAEASEG